MVPLFLPFVQQPYIYTINDIKICHHIPKQDFARGKRQNLYRIFASFFVQKDKKNITERARLKTEKQGIIIINSQK